MTYADKIRWLRRYGDARRQQRVLEKEIEALRSDAERVTPLLGALPGGAGEGGRVPRAVEAILEAQEQLRAQCDQCAARLEEGKDPMCVHHCQAFVMRYGDAAELAKGVEEGSKSVLYYL